MKRVLTVLLSLAIILSLFSACGNGSKTAETAVIGQWYNNKGNSLYISSDRTYRLKLEDDYGTWKALDSKTIEFTDSYGRTSEAKIDIDESGREYLDLEYHGTYYRNESSVASDTSIGATINYTLKGSYSFSDDRAAIEYEDSVGKSYAALIDTDGRILYKIENGTVMNDYGFSGIACFGSTVSDNYYIVNRNGELVATSQDFGFDEVLAYGDGMALVFKEERGESENQYYYGVIDENGNWMQELQKFKNLYSEARYAGSGIFLLKNPVPSGYSYSSYDKAYELYCELYNANTGKSMRGIISTGIQFIGNIAYCAHLYISTTDSGDYEPTDLYNVGINTNFEIIENFDYVGASGKYLFSESNDKHLMITDPQTGMISELKEYDRTQIYNIKFDGDHALVLIEGNDNNYYFTVIDQNANIMFEPRRYDLEEYYSGSKFRISFGDDKVAYCSSDNWFIVDAEGNMIAENLPYYNIDSFSNGIACASRSYEMTWSGTLSGTDYCFINSKGEQVLQYLYE